MNELVKNPLVSVRVLAYNHEKYIAECLEGIVSQKTDFPFEVIIGEDCSTDRTREICRDYKAKYPNLINLIESETNLGAHLNGERTIAAYRGKYIAWCDGDDYWTDPYKLQKQVDILERREDISICFHKVKIINETENLPPIISNPHQKTVSTIYDLAYINFIHAPSVMFRNNLFEPQNEILRNIPARDYAVHLLNASKGDIYFINEVMAVYREHRGSVWASKPLKERHNLHLKTQDAILGLFNRQVDEIILHSKAMYLYDLYRNYKETDGLSEVKKYLISSLKILVELTHKPEIEPLLNSVLDELKPILDRTKDYEALQCLGKLAFDKKMFKDSAIFLNDSLKINKDNLEIYKVLAKAYFESGEVQKATAEISNYLRANPNDIEAIVLLAKLLMLNQNSISQAISMLERLVAKGVQDFDVFKTLANAYYAIDNIKSSLSSIVSALNIYRYDAEALRLYSKLKAISGEVEAVETPAEENLAASVHSDSQASDVKQSEKLVSIIILTHNNPNSLQSLINSIHSVGSRYKFEIVVIDIASSEPTINLLKRLAISKNNFRFYRSNKRINFAKAANIGIRNSDGDYIILLDEITEVRKNWIENLVDTYESNQQIGLVSSVILDSSGCSIHSSGVGIEFKDGMLHFSNLDNSVKLDKYKPSSNISTVQAVSQSCIMLSRELLPEIGIFDETYSSFLACVDISLRASEIEKQSVCRNDSFVLKGAASSVTQPSESEIELFLKHHLKKFSAEEGNLLLTAQKQKIADALRNYKESGNKERYEQIVKVLLASDYDKYSEDFFFERDVPEDLLKLAELIIDGETDNSFDFSDIFGLDEPAENEIEAEEIPQETEVESKKSLKILLTMYGWNESGGGTTFPKSVAKRLARNGNEVAVFYATAEHPSIKEPYYMEYKVEDGVHLYGIYNRPTVFLDANNPDREVRDEDIVKLFTDVLEKFNPDIVHFNNFLGLSFAIAGVAKERGYPTVFTPHNYHFIDPTLYLYNSDLSLWKNTDFFENSELAYKNPYLTNAYQRRIEAAQATLNRDIDLTLAVSSRVKELLVQFGANPNKITVVHQVHASVENLMGSIAEKQPPSLPLRFGYIGAVMPHKGAHILVQAAQLIPSDKAEFYIYGFGIENYMNLLKALDKNKVVKLMGEYKPESLGEISNNLDVMILPSVWEDCAPLVIVESLAMKLPVIASRIGGYPDFIKDGINGKLYSHGSPSELAGIINHLINNPSIVSEWRSNCIVSHTFDDYISHISSIYRLLISKHSYGIDDIKLIF